LTNATAEEKTALSATEAIGKFLDQTGATVYLLIIAPALPHITIFTLVGFANENGKVYTFATTATAIFFLITIAKLIF
jgi:hypothetical protein